MAKVTLTSGHGYTKISLKVDLTEAVGPDPTAAVSSNVYVPVG